MNNICLKKELKGTINNSNLPEFETLKIRVKNTNGNKKTINRVLGTAGVSAVLSIENGSLFSYGSDVAEPSINFSIGGAFSYIANDNCIIRIKPKYNLTGLKFDKYAIIDNMYQSNGTISDDYVFDLEEFKYCKNYSTIRFVGDAKGDIVSAFGGLAVVPSEFTFIAGPLTGDIVELVKSWGEGTAALTSGTIETFQVTSNTTPLYTAKNVQITFNGTRLSFSGTMSYQRVSSGVYKISLVDNTRVYCYGYSDGEIATNTAAGGIWEGKTVTKYD